MNPIPFFDRSIQLATECPECKTSLMLMLSLIPEMIPKGSMLTTRPVLNLVTPSTSRLIQTPPLSRCNAMMFPKDATRYPMPDSDCQPDMCFSPTATLRTPPTSTYLLSDSKTLVPTEELLPENCMQVESSMSTPSSITRTSGILSTRDSLISPPPVLREPTILNRSTLVSGPSKKRKGSKLCRTTAKRMVTLRSDSSADM